MIMHMIHYRSLSAPSEHPHIIHATRRSLTTCKSACKACLRSLLPNFDRIARHLEALVVSANQCRIQGVRVDEEDVS